MGELLLIAWRNARGSLGRTGMTLAAVCVGVAFLTGSLAVSDTLARTLAVLYSSQDDSVDVVVRGESVAFGQGTSLDEALVAQAAAAPGAAAAAGGVEVLAQPTDLAGNPLQIATDVSMQTVTVAGIADVSSGTESALTWFEPATAQSLLGSPGLVQEIFVASDGWSTSDELATAVAGSLGAGAEVLTGAQAAEESPQAVLPAQRAARIDVLDAIRGE